MTLNQRKEYDDNTEGQGSKKNALVKANDFVDTVMSGIGPLLAACTKYESELKLSNAPAVQLPGGKLAIAPDVKCVTKKGKVFWIEVKDKSQRFFYPDTGADLFQVYGWYNIAKFYGEPVYVLFKDPAFESCLPEKTDPVKKEQFRKRWDLFGGAPYGGWLSDLLVPDERYPRIFPERSRELFMYILYFRVARMKKTTGWEQVIAMVDNNAVRPVPQELKAFSNGTGQLAGEAHIRALITEIFTKNNPRG